MSRILAGMMAVILALGWPLIANPGSEAPSPWRLSGHCPPGFTLDEAQTCRLQSLYRGYSSLQDAGVGGLQTGLPTIRDGFSPQQIDLGRLLFFDPVLSVDGSMACASCHDPDLGFADGRGRSLGMGDKPLQRSAPGLWNAGLLQRFFWDGRAASLEQQMEGPLYDENEMANTPANLLTTLRSIPAYVAMFQQAYGESPITLEQVYSALAGFEASLVSLNSRYDLYAHGFHAALSQREIDGLNVFRSFVARCAECHTPPLFTNQQIAVLGTPEPEGMALDIGAQGPSGDPSLRAGFKVPSLRNIALTAPYMHSGRFTTLRETVAFYTQGRGHAVPEGEKLSLHWHIWEPDLSEEELDLLVDFLHTLTDESYKPEVPASLPSGLEPVNKNIELVEENRQ